MYNLNVFNIILIVFSIIVSIITIFFALGNFGLLKLKFLSRIIAFDIYKQKEDRLFQMVKNIAIQKNISMNHIEKTNMGEIAIQNKTNIYNDYEETFLVYKINLELELFQNYYKSLKKHKEIEQYKNIEYKIISEFIAHKKESTFDEIKKDFQIINIFEFKDIKNKIIDEYLNNIELFFLKRIISEHQKLNLVNPLSRFIKLYYSKGIDKELDDLIHIIIEKEEK